MEEENEQQKEKAAVAITGVSTRDVRFKNGEGDGTDAVHSEGTYGYSICCLHTNYECFEGSGLAFTLGRGNESVNAAIVELAEVLIGRDVEELMSMFGSVWHSISEHPTLRWLGPHKGHVHLALAAITNACFDLWAKVRGQPLWKLLLSLSTEALVNLCDFSFVDDVMSAEDAAQLIDEHRATRTEREVVIEEGYPGYDTSFGWLHYSDEQLEEKAQSAISRGFDAVKLKVGSKDTTRDVRRAKLVRGILGPDVRIMLDVNQQWSIAKGKRMWEELKEMNPFWLEEPTQPDDVFGHKDLMDYGIPVAVGEAIPNRVLFKNFMQAKACQFIQVDPTRTGGISECLVVALMSRKYGLPIAPHVGDMGQLSQHLVLFYHIALGTPKLFLEYIPHLANCFTYPAHVHDGVYETPRQPGASSDIVSDVGDFSENGLFDTEAHAHISTNK
eukprot:m.84670 g.84670  ORF g.84670 m.84670 type:complete len:444 (+) comp12164_c0_seq1:89-1420(+)